METLFSDKYELILLAIAAIVSGFLSDLRARKKNSDEIKLKNKELENTRQEAENNFHIEIMKIQNTFIDQFEQRTAKMEEQISAQELKIKSIIEENLALERKVTELTHINEDLNEKLKSFMQKAS